MGIGIHNIYICIKNILKKGKALYNTYRKPPDIIIMAYDGINIARIANAVQCHN